MECERDPENASDRYTVAVKKELPSDICLERHCGLLFLRRGGSYYRMYSNRAQEIFTADLAQGGLEVPCSLLFKATLMESVGSESPMLALQ